MTHNPASMTRDRLSPGTREEMCARRSASTRLLSPDIVSAMRDHVSGLTDEALNERFGISYNSWRKIMTGAPVNGGAKVGHSAA